MKFKVDQRAINEIFVTVVFKILISISIHSLFFLSHLKLELSHSALQLQELHVKGSLLTTHRSSLLLKARVLSFLVSIVAFHLFFDFEVFIGKSFANFLRLQGQYRLKRVFLGAEYLHLALVEVKFFSELANHILSANID